MTKKMTFLIPAYKGLKWLELNANFWKKITEFVHVILVEDSTENQMKSFCLSNNITYFSKENGNWGSVLNFVKNNNLISTEWMAIVDVDDMVDLDELEKLLSFLEKKHESDVVFTGTKVIDFVSKKEVISFHKWIHSAWFKTRLLYEVSDLPENVFYSDNFIVAKFHNSNFVQNKNISPYMYFNNIPGQSTDVNNVDKLVDKLKSMRELAKIESWLEQNNIFWDNHSISFCKYFILTNIRNLLDRSASRAEIKKLKELYKQELIFLKTFTKIPISKRLIWSFFYRIWTFKWIKVK